MPTLSALLFTDSTACLFSTYASLSLTGNQNLNARTLLAFSFIPLSPFSQDSEVPQVFRQIAVKNFDGSQFETKQVFYPSKDGTKIPMFIIHRKDLTLDASSPAFLYGKCSDNHVVCTKLYIPG